jgi:hypothetical protein
MTTWFKQLRDYVGSAAFENERRLARQEFFGELSQASTCDVASTVMDSGPEVLDDKALLEDHPNYSDWFLFDRCHSRSSRTPVRMYVEQHPDLPERIRTNLLGCEQSISSVFAVAAAADDMAVVLDLEGDRSDYYRVARGADAPELAQGGIIRARLVHWDDGWYFHGDPCPWPSSPRDVLGERPARGGRRVAGERRALAAPEAATRPRATRLATRGSWLRERRTHP